MPMKEMEGIRMAVAYMLVFVDQLCPLKVCAVRL